MKDFIEVPRNGKWFQLRVSSIVGFGEQMPDRTEVFLRGGHVIVLYMSYETLTKKLSALPPPAIESVPLNLAKIRDLNQEIKRLGDDFNA